jgi:hypothetical protein
MGKRASLTDFTARKSPAGDPPSSPPEPAPPAAVPERLKAAERRAQTLRLTPAAWRQLKQLALDHGKPAHDLLVEAVNDLFRKNDKPPIA